jgi:hypothetical protein
VRLEIIPLGARFVKMLFFLSMHFFLKLEFCCGKKKIFTAGGINLRVQTFLALLFGSGLKKYFLKKAIFSDLHS